VKYDSTALLSVADTVKGAWRSLRLRLTLACVGILLLGIWGTVSYVSMELRNDMERELGEQQLALVSGMAAGIDTGMRDRIHALEALASILAPTLLQRPTAVQAELMNRPAYQVLFNLGLFVLSADGTVIADDPSTPQRRGRNFMSDLDVQRTLQLGKATVGRPNMGPLLKAPVFSILVPVRDTKGTVIGALGGLTGLGQVNFLDLVPNAWYGKTGHFQLVAPLQRLVVTATDKGRVMATLPEIGVNTKLDALLAKGAGTDIWYGSDGVEVLTSVARIPNAGWLVEVRLPTKEAFEPIREIQQRAVVMAVALSAVAAMLVWWLLQRELASVTQASTALRQRSGSPALYLPLQIARQDEIGDLIAGFNALLLELQQREQAQQDAATALAIASELQERTGALAHVGGWQVDLQTMKLTWTRETFRIAEREGVLEPPLVDGINLFAPDARPAISAAVQAAIDTGTPYDLELPIIGERGTHKWVRTQGFAVVQNGKSIRLHGTFQDITQRKQNDLLVATALAEKTALLNEVHHRVKNNLQVITSLLRLEAARVDPSGSNTKAVLTDMQGRVRSMALLHESLYRTGVFASVDLGTYLSQLAQQAFRALTFDNKQVRLELDLNTVHLGLDQALPCGLLVNELLSNATKHGFPPGHSGVVRVELRALAGSRCRVSVSDNGIGLPTDFEQRREKSLGLQLVSDLSAQLGGALVVGPGPHSHFSVEFECSGEVVP
jgi:two-component sensor histidine kinase/PAS domain-containing protein